MTEPSDPLDTSSLVGYRLQAVEKAVKGFEVRFDTKLDAMVGKFVSAELYNADKLGNSERHQRAEDRIRDLEQEATEREKQARTTRLSISLASVSGVIAVVGIIAGLIR